MKKIIFILASAALLVAGTSIAQAFTIENHATVAYIAEKHMTPAALNNFHKAFDNHPLVEFASYPDFFRAIYLVNDKKVGHSIELDENLYPVVRPEGKSLKAYDGLLRAIDELKNYKNLDDSTKYAAMGLLVHFMGDSHCPSHLSFPDKRSKIKNIYFKMYYYDEKEKPKKINYHSFWDSWASDQRYPHGFVERAMMFDLCNDKQIKKIQEGTLEDWIHASAVACQDTYDVENEQLVDRVYVIKKAELVATQIRDAGYRLAALMNQLFAK